MKKYLGLLLKDFYLLRAYTKNLIISLLIYAILIYTQLDNQMVIIGAIMVAFLFTMFGLSTFSYDERNHSDRFMLTLPITKKDIILGKYLLTFIMMLLGLVLGLVMGLIFLQIKLHTIVGVKDILMGLMIGSIFTVFLQCVQIPCMFKWGAEKGRIQLYIVFILLAAIISVILFIKPDIDFTFLDKIDKFVPYIILLIDLILYIVSYFISCLVYKKREV